MMTYHVELTELPHQPAAVVRARVTVAEIPGFLGAAFGEVVRVLAGQHLSPAGPPFARFHRAGDSFDAEAGFPATGPVSPEGRVETGVLPGGPAATVLHRGAYEAVAGAYAAANDWLAANGYVGAGEPWESYLDGAELAEPRTVVHLPCRPA